MVSFFETKKVKALEINLGVVIIWPEWYFHVIAICFAICFSYINLKLILEQVVQNLEAPWVTVWQDTLYELIGDCYQVLDQ